MNILTALDAASSATRALVFKTWAGGATFTLINMVKNLVLAEQKAIAEAKLDPNGAMDAYSKMRDEAQDDNGEHGIAGVDEKLSLNLLVEYTAAVRATALTTAEGLSGRDRQFSKPQSIADSLAYMATPKSKVDSEQILVAKEQMPDLTEAQIVTYIQNVAISDAAPLLAHRETIISRVEELLRDAPADREFDTIVADLPEAMRYAMLDKACIAMTKEIARLAEYVIRGVPDTAAKRRFLRADLPALEALAA